MIYLLSIHQNFELNNIKKEKREWKILFLMSKLIWELLLQFNKSFSIWAI